MQYRLGDSGDFTDGPQDLTGTSTSITALTMNTAYQVQVRMTTAAGDSEWSPNGRGSTHPPEVTVLSGWNLKPTVLAAGAKFRLLFITSTTRNAVPTAIADYNRFVQGRAAAGHPDIGIHSSGFRAVGSTEYVDARDNTSTTYTSSDKGVPIYWLDGNKVVDDYEDFYDGDWDEETTLKDESGDTFTATSSTRVWTGSNGDGTESIIAGFSACSGREPSQARNTE